MAIQSGLSESAAKELLKKDPDQLYELLGMTAKAVEEDIGKQGSFEPEVVYSPHMGLMDDLQKIGRRMFNRAQRQAYDLVCGSDPEDEEDRRKIITALGISSAAAVIALAGVLVSTFGLAAAFAGVIAPLIIKRFAEPVLEDGYKGFCQLWKEDLPQSNE